MILDQIDTFLAEFPLSDGRAGTILARDRRLLDRLRNGGRVWPEKEAEILRNIEIETAKRRGGHTSNDTPKVRQDKGK